MSRDGSIHTRIPDVEEKLKLEKVLLEQIESHIGYQPRIIEVSEIFTEVVTGTNYYVKACVKIGSHNYIHARIFEHMQCYGGEITVESVLENMSSMDLLSYF
ncbi:Stefin-1 [Fasciola gigantica]|uniref:Stefin-1 n=1 Tax=Fasciola gigantica TaxID=46835 RepID=A0A504YM78_FASGI|nr:Stefin-1 [Fasciola gigantica]